MSVRFGVVATAVNCVAALAMPGASAQTPDQAAPVVETAARFDVWEYRIIGNTTLPAIEVERAVYAHLGPARTIADVESARAALEKAYHAAGYGAVFVDIPEQNTDQGVVRLSVSEGRVDRVRITGARYFSNGQIREALPALRRGDVLHLPQVQSQLAALNRASPDRTVAPVLKAGRTPGTVDVELKVDDELPVHGSLEVNDRYTANTSKTRLNASLSYGNLFQRQHSLSFQYQIAPEEPDEVQAMVGSYAFRPQAMPDATFALYAVDSQTDVAALGALAVLGEGQIMGARFIRALPELQNYYHNVSLGLDYKDFLENVQLDPEQELRTPISYLNWSLAYSATLRGEAAVSGFNASANFGLRQVVNDLQEFQDKRLKGAPNYFYLRGGAHYLRPLFWDMQIFGRIAGQFTQDPLVSNEQFAIGGVDTVRGYFESSQLGDYGVAGTIELRNVWPARALQLPTESTYLFAFYDAGRAAILNPLPAQTAQTDLASSGLGLRVSGWRGFDLAFDWARALKATDSVEAGDSRTHFSFRYSF